MTAAKRKSGETKYSKNQMGLGKFKSNYLEEEAMNPSTSYGNDILF